jgi:hypothetical protein
MVDVVSETRRYKFKRYPPSEVPVVEDMATIIDEKWRLGIKTAGRMKFFYISKTVHPVLSIQLYYDSDLKQFVMGFYPVVQLGDSEGKVINPATKEQLKGILKASVFNAAVSANADIFATNIAPTYDLSLFRIYCAFNAAGVLSVVRTRGGTSVVENLNAGASLSANAAYMFDVLVEGNESINLRYSVAATCLVLKVVEVYGMVS